MDINDVKLIYDETMLDTIPGGFVIYEINSSFNIVSINDHALKIFGYHSYDDLKAIGHSYLNLIYEKDREHFSDYVYTDSISVANYRVVDVYNNLKYIEQHNRMLRVNNKHYCCAFINEISLKPSDKKEVVDNYFKQLKDLFDKVRIVDVNHTKCRNLEENYEGICYEIWNKEHRCENCIAAKVLSSKKQLSKYEFIDDEPYYVIAKYIELDGKPYILELVNKVDDSVLLDSYGKSNFAASIRNYNNKLYMDSLTEAYNRNYLDEQLVNLDGISAIAMVDIDNFKQVNDLYGHDAGDKALQKLVSVIKSCIRKYDTVVRLGGDEFLVIFDSIPNDKLFMRLDSIRSKVEMAVCDDYPDLHITISIGGVKTTDCGVESRKLADKALYEAKKTKNSVKVIN